jgi:hypothetical protein
MNRTTFAPALIRVIGLFVVAALLVLLAGLLATSQPARADIHIVTNTNNDGAGSLREAIDDANNNPGPDTITFDAATNGTAIILAGAAGDDNNDSGDLDILDPAGGDLTIQGNGVANTIIDGGEVDRVFHVCPNGGCADSVTISGLTIQNGSVKASGGGIRHQAGTLTVDGCSVRANAAYQGGGISNRGTLSVTNSTIGGIGLGNRATDGSGGGIYNWGVTTVNNSTVISNTAAGHGGGIFSEQGTLIVRNGSTIGVVGAGNHADIDGGGIHNYAGTTTVENSTVISNTADDDGGGIYNNTGTTTLDGSTVGGNRAVDGGGIYNEATLVIRNGSTIGGVDALNRATSGGGGIYNEAGTTTVDGSTVSANEARSGGGGICNWETLIVTNSTIGGTGAGNRADRGGGILNGRGTTTVDGSTVSANVADSGGGIFNEETLTVTNSTIGGAGVGNRATTGCGGGIHNDYDGTTAVDGSTIISNTAVCGGGIYNSERTTRVSSSTVISNTANRGGGIFNAMGRVEVDGTTLRANRANESGGGFYTGVDGGTYVDGSTIISNTADLGGGIYVREAGGTRVTGSRILLNTATTDGGGVYSSAIDDGATDVTNSCIVGNSVMAFRNVQDAPQIATHNWWGAATGPNTAGADTVLGNVDVVPHLTAPILGCGPDLQVTKANDTGGEAYVGSPFNWTLTVSNAGLLDASFNAGQTILEDDLPGGPTYGAPSAGNFVGIANSAAIDCAMAGNTLTCEATGATVTIRAAGRFDVTISVTPNALVTLVNPAGNCGVDPDGHVTEGDETNNDCPADSVNVTTRSIYSYLPIVLR